MASAQLPAPLEKTETGQGAEYFTMHAIFTFLLKSVTGRITITYIDYKVFFLMAEQSKTISQFKHNSKQSNHFRQNVTSIYLSTMCANVTKMVGI